MLVSVMLLRTTSLAKRLNLAGSFKGVLKLANTEYSDMSSVREEFVKIPGKGKITLEKDDETGIAVMTLEHEEHRNAISAPMIVDLIDVMFNLESWKLGKGLIVWGGSKFFCSGADLHMVRHMSSSGAVNEGEMLSSTMQDLLSRLLNLPLVSVAVVNGKALGGGGELTTACDYRLMARDAEVHFVHKRMGVVTGWGGGPRLVSLVGRTTALEMLVGCKRLSAEEALRLGFASGIVTPGEEALSEARQWLKERIEGATEAVRAMKQLVAFSHESRSARDSLELERKLFSALFGGGAQRKALEQNIKHKH